MSPVPRPVLLIRGTFHGGPCRRSPHARSHARSSDRRAHARTRARRAARAMCIVWRPHRIEERETRARARPEFGTNKYATRACACVCNVLFVCVRREVALGRGRTFHARASLRIVCAARHARRRRRRSPASWRVLVLVAGCRRCRHRRRRSPHVEGCCLARRLVACGSRARSDPPGGSCSTV